MTNEAFARVKFDALLVAQDGNMLSSNAVRLEATCERIPAARFRVVPPETCVR